MQTYIDCIIKHDPIWVETAYLQIVRRRQMEELRMIPEDEWPSKAELQQYDRSRFPEEENFYEPHDLISNLGLWLRDHRIRARKEQVRQKNEAKKQQIQNYFN